MTVSDGAVNVRSMRFRRVTIVGLGLLGGSLALALRRLADPPLVVGYAHRPATLLRAREMDLADVYTDDLQEAVRGAELVVLATPVGAFGKILQELGAGLTEGAVVSDVGSTKRTVCRLASQLLPKGVWFVGCHPMAGGERTGPENARADLFVHAPVIVTPTVVPSGAAASPPPCGSGPTGGALGGTGQRPGAETSPPHGASPDATPGADVEQMWRVLHARVVQMDAETHDRLVASVSHLPHLTASMLVTLQSLPALEVSGPGYRDATRTAAGDPDLWRDILMDNRDCVAESLRRLREETEVLLRLLETGDAERLRDYLAQAAVKRGAAVRERTPMV